MSRCTLRLIWRGDKIDCYWGFFLRVCISSDRFILFVIRSFCVRSSGRGSWGRCRCSFKWFTRKAVFARHFGKRQNWKKMRSHEFFGELQNTHLPENICRTSQDFRVVVWEKGYPLLHLVDFSYIVWTNSVQENILRQQFTDARIYNPSLPPISVEGRMRSPPLLQLRWSTSNDNTKIISNQWTLTFWS